MVGMTEGKRKTVIYSCIVVLFMAAGLSPLIFPIALDSSINPSYHGLFKILLASVPVCAAVLCHKIRIDYPEKQKTAAFIFMISLSLLLVYIHHIYIDTTDSYFHRISNHDWQLRKYRGVMSLDPAAIPHSYRFLPYSIIRMAEFLTGDFSYARLLYRLTFTFLLVFSIYYYGRLHYSHEKALLGILLYAAVYPVSIRYYAGQPTDPLSHLSFVLAFIFLDLNLFMYFLLTVGIGILAKESILVVSAFFLLFRRKEKNYMPKAVLLLMVSISITLVIRLWIVPGQANISDVFILRDLKRTALPHLINNLEKFRVWSKQILFTVGIFVPFLVLGWKNTSPKVRNLAVFLLATLLLSNLIFGWLSETRNLMPAVVPLALITADYLFTRIQKPV